MKKYILLILFNLNTFFSISQTNNDIYVDGLLIDPNIKIEAEKHFSDYKNYSQLANIIQIYDNSFLGEFYENDTLSFSNSDSSKKIIFKAFYFWKDNVLGINGAFGLFGGTGFYIKISNNKATLYHMLSSDDFPTYAYNEKDQLIDRLEVACSDTKIVLSEIPNKENKQLIYGYVEFKSDSYYSADGANFDGENPPKIKLRNNMRIYFKCGFIEL
ncbi:hypothetical protein [Flavobacterium sp.]|uniref:hypothetical protein n=1 Tax=Flavobacterium sp. TaxID=239 RepID=UPI002B4B89D5|nr:hypothetical protein [Flavobacterium sp.]HLP63125.1 hypothetical protein [Flavobacterium sp.]